MDALHGRLLNVWRKSLTAIKQECCMRYWTKPQYIHTFRGKDTNYKGYHHHHHHIVLAARISLTLSRHSSLSFIALGRSSGQQPVSSHSCWMYVRAGRPAFARPCVGIHKSTSLMSSSLLLQQCPAWRHQLNRRANLGLFKYTTWHIPDIGMMVRVFAYGPETWVQSQVESYQRFKKWYLMLPCLTLSIIWYGSRVKWSNPGKGVAPSPTPWCSSYRKGSLRVTLDYGRQLYFTYMAYL